MIPGDARSNLAFVDATCTFFSEVTITQHDRLAEMLAAVRRGPLATPDEFEKIEYLFTRVKKGQAVWRFDRFALEHTLSYQRRVHAIKTNFMVRQQPTPLGVLVDYWDRTLAGNTASLSRFVCYRHFLEVWGT